jgi:hypothetical protein
MPTLKNEVTGTEEPAIVGVSAHYTGIWGETQGPASGVYGSSQVSYGVFGESQASAGVRGSSIDGRGVEGWSTNTEGVVGISTNSTGVWGQNEGAGTGVAGTSKTGIGVLGQSETGQGVVGRCEKYQGVFGLSGDNAGIVGESQRFHAIFGVSHGSNNGGVIGINDAGGWGVIGRSDANTGVSGETASGRGVHGMSKTGQGVLATSEDNDGVRAMSTKGNGVSAFGGHTGIFAKAPVNAGFFEGNIHVTGNITAAGDVILHNADCAEDFDIADAAAAAPGTVMVLGEEGVLRPSQQAYDKRVAGVVSGAGHYRPGIVLDKQEAGDNRKPIALLGKVCCKVDAQYGAVEIGDLLTTSDTPGHAMKAADPGRAFGAVIGKALRPLAEGQGLVPILIAL